MKQSNIDWIGEIPDGWEIYQLSQLVKQVKNKNSLLQEKNLLSLSYGSIKRKDINSSDGLLPASFDGYNIIENGDIVLRLTDLQNDHTSLRVGRASERGIITSAYTTLHPINIDHSKFLYYMLHSFDLKKGFYGMGAGVRQGLNYDEVKSLKVPLPPLAEQQKIAAYLDKKISQIDAIITEAKQSIEEYKAWKQSVIFEAVTGKNKSGAKKDSGIEWIGEIPEGWEVVFLFQLVKLIKNKNLELKESNLLSLSYGKIKRRNINANDGLLPASFDGYNIIENGDIVLRLTDLQNDHTSLRVGIATETGIITSAYTTVRPNNSIFSNYLYYYLHSFDVKKGFYGMGAGVRQGLNFAELKKLLIILPSYHEQEVIAKMLDSKCAQIDSLIAEKESLIADLADYKKSLIFEVVTGKNQVSSCEFSKENSGKRSVQ